MSNIKFIENASKLQELTQNKQTSIIVDLINIVKLKASKTRLLS